MKDALLESINEIANLPNEDKVNIKGKFYTTVDKRVQVFRKHLGSSGKITTNIIINDLERVVVEACVYINRGSIWELIGNDHAEEFRSQGMVNKTSALENCCTSAIGRALAACGLGGGEYATSFEVDNAINNKKEAPDTTKGYNIKNLEGGIVINCETEEDFLEEMRKQYDECKKNETSFKGIYLMNKKEIQKASAAADDKVKDGYEALIEIGESV